MDDLPISEELKTEFIKWIVEYQKEATLLKERSSQYSQEFIFKHNDKGRRLTARLIKELGEDISIVFIPLSQI